MALKGIIVNGTTYQYDYDYLANKPDIPFIPDYSNVMGKHFLTASDSGLEWTTLPEIPEFDSSYVGQVLTVSGCGCAVYLSWETP